jgi:nitroreductase
MNPILENILTRRSVRKYKTEQIADLELESILEAAKYAPSGGNSQSWHFTVVQNADKLEELNQWVRNAFSNLVVDDTTYHSKKTGKAAATNESYNFYYHAPTLIIVSNEREYSNALVDTGAALQNIFLAAHALDIGSCWINQLTWFCDEIPVRSMLNSLRIPENHKVCGAAALGYIARKLPKAAPRKEGTVHIVS